MTARMRHGVVDSSTATTVDVSLDGVIVTAFLLDGVVLTAGMTATLVQDGRRLVAVGGIASQTWWMFPGLDSTMEQVTDVIHPASGGYVTPNKGASPSIIYNRWHMVMGSWGVALLSGGTMTLSVRYTATDPAGDALHYYHLTPGGDPSDWAEWDVTATGTATDDGGFWVNSYEFTVDAGESPWLAVGPTYDITVDVYEASLTFTPA